jgi:hypothetical protein
VRSAVADPLEDLERQVELLALVAEQLVQFGALPGSQGGGGEAARRAGRNVLARNRTMKSPAI